MEVDEPSTNAELMTHKDLNSSVRDLQIILHHNFTDKSLLEYSLKPLTPKKEKPVKFQRLELLGDSVLGLALMVYLYHECSVLSMLKQANVSNEKFARVAIKHRLYPFLQRHNPRLDIKVEEFSKAVAKEKSGSVLYGGVVRAPKTLADMVESIAGAVYLDVFHDMTKFWDIFKPLLEPIYKPEDLYLDPELLVRLQNHCRGTGIQMEYTCIEVGTDNFECEIFVDNISKAGAMTTTKYRATIEAADKVFKSLLPTYVPIEKYTAQELTEQEENGKYTAKELTEQKENEKYTALEQEENEIKEDLPKTELGFPQFQELVEKDIEKALQFINDHPRETSKYLEAFAMAELDHRSLKVVQLYDNL